MGDGSDSRQPRRYTKEGGSRRHAKVPERRSLLRSSRRRRECLADGRPWQGRAERSRVYVSHPRVTWGWRRRLRRQPSAMYIFFFCGPLRGRIISPTRCGGRPRWGRGTAGEGDADPLAVLVRLARVHFDAPCLPCLPPRSHPPLSRTPRASVGTGKQPPRRSPSGRSLASEAASACGALVFLAPSACTPSHLCLHARIVLCCRRP